MLAFTGCMLSCSGPAPSGTRKSAEADTRREIVTQSSQPELLLDTTVTIDNRQYFMTVARDNKRNKEERINALLLLIDRDRDTTLISDSLFCQAGLFGLKDFNRDGRKDILIHSYSGGRGANGFYYLYLNKGTYFSRVAQFDTIVSPEPNKNGLIISSAFYGDKINEKFLYFDKDDRIKSTDVSVELTLTGEGERDTKEYSKAYDKALQVYKKDVH